MLAEDLAALARCPLFRAVPRDELAGRMRATEHHIHGYSVGALIRSRGDRCDELLVMLRGQAAGEFQDYEGHVLRVETIPAPETLASAFLFAPDPRFPVNIIALTQVRICSFPRASVIRLARESDHIMGALLADVGSRASFLAEKLRLTQFATLRQKVAGYLWERASALGKDSVPLSGTQASLAELFGVARPSLGRVLHELESVGVIEREGRRIRILDRKRLRNLLVDQD
ncbi:Crp/Fnr family transcriptional regulator [Salinispira pacifica]